MRIVIAISFLMLSLILNAQEFSGEAIYKSIRDVDLNLDDKPGLNGEMAKLIKERMRDMFKKTYSLTFNTLESSYTENKTLDNSKNSNNLNGSIQVFNMVGAGSDDGIFYKNLKEKRYVNKTEISGKTFLIKDDLVLNKWVLENETKSIGIYICNKATFTQEIEDIEFSEANEMIKNGTKKITTTAWYTMEIPVSNGPGKYFGLPGLILEIQKEDLTIVCTKVTLNKKPVKVNEPSKGKIVNQQQFDKIQTEKAKELMERLPVGVNGVQIIRQ